jgi:hypothetical protein
VTAAPEVALRSLLADLCATEDAEAFAARWGRTEPSRHRPRGLRVECAPTSPFAALEVRPWSDDVTGVVEVELPAAGALSWADLRDHFGPFTSLPRLHESGAEYGVRWTPSGGRVSAYLIVGRDGDDVRTLTIRRDPP